MQIRKMFTVIEESGYEAGAAGPVAGEKLRKVAVVAVLQNPFAGSYVDDLSPLTEASVEIGRQMAAMAAQAMAPYKLVSYGKAGVVGLAGEQEHVAAMLTTAFGTVMRDAAGGGAAWISSFTKRAGPGGTIDVPLAHKDALYVRSHYDGMTLLLADAPLPDEIAIICAYANRGRLHARVGGLAAADIIGKDGLV